ncbi:protein PELOTA 1 [Dorcoceras hygrometricum]|uniref:Protein PELOTA 1 n=1 Tax=Dorcoceras hygrometricum TaxID=472368 RepID=A0A2Z7B8K6_9LAMI|nr:protein PELOTA 1 [Dorcoceras hygrometricum]
MHTTVTKTRNKLRASRRPASERGQHPVSQRAQQLAQHHRPTCAFHPAAASPKRRQASVVICSSGATSLREWCSTLRDARARVSMTFQVMRTNQYNQDLGLIHSTNGNQLESPNEGSSIDHQVTIYLHAQNITMFPTNETCSGIQLAMGPQPLLLQNHNFGLAHRIMVKRLATSPHDHLGITDSACKNQLVVVSVQYGPFNTYIPIRSTIIDSIGYPRMKASGESSTTKHRLLHASRPHPILPPNDPKRVGKRVKVRRLSCRVSMKFRVVRTNKYNQDLGLIHSTNGNHLESPNEGSSIDHQLDDLIRHIGGARRNLCVCEFLRQLTREFLSSFELLDLSFHAVPAMFFESSEGADW